MRKILIAFLIIAGSIPAYGQHPYKQGGFRSQKNLMTYYHYHRVIYINHTLIAYGLTSFDSLKNNSKELYDFYATFKVTLPHSEISQETIADTLFNTKAALWAALALLCGVLIIFIIKKFA